MDKELNLLRRRLWVYKGRYKEVANRAGLNINWLYSFSKAVESDPGIRKIKALTETLDEMDGEAV